MILSIILIWVGGFMMGVAAGIWLVTSSMEWAIKAKRSCTSPADPTLGNEHLEPREPPRQ